MAYKRRAQSARLERRVRADRMRAQKQSETLRKRHSAERRWIQSATFSPRARRTAYDEVLRQMSSTSSRIEYRPQSRSRKRVRSRSNVRRPNVRRRRPQSAAAGSSSSRFSSNNNNGRGGGERPHSRWNRPQRPHPSNESLQKSNPSGRGLLAKTSKSSLPRLPKCCKTSSYLGKVLEKRQGKFPGKISKKRICLFHATDNARKVAQDNVLGSEKDCGVDTGRRCHAAYRREEAHSCAWADAAPASR